MVDPWTDILARMQQVASALQSQADIETDPNSPIHGWAQALSERVRLMSDGYGAVELESRADPG